MNEYKSMSENIQEEFEYFFNQLKEEDFEPIKLNSSIKLDDDLKTYELSYIDGNKELISALTAADAVNMVGTKAKNLSRISQSTTPLFKNLFDVT